MGKTVNSLDHQYYLVNEDKKQYFAHRGLFNREDRPENSMAAYRAAVENIICAPYGTIELINLEQLIKTSQELHEEKKRR